MPLVPTCDKLAIMSPRPLLSGMISRCMPTLPTPATRTWISLAPFQTNATSMIRILSTQVHIMSSTLLAPTVLGAAASCMKLLSPARLPHRLPRRLPHRLPRRLLPRLHRPPPTIHHKTTDNPALRVCQPLLLC